MKKAFIVCMLIFALVPFVVGFSGPAPEPEEGNGEAATGEKAAYPYLIDNYEDGNYDTGPEWFVFDKVSPAITKNTKFTSGDPAVVAVIGNYSLALKGSTSGWYVGGIGTMLGIDATKYKSLEMDVFGTGANSGRLKVEFYDDDNGNKEIEVDKNWIPTSDDLWSYEIEVNWKGWKHLSIPFTNFTLANKGRGNGKFDPALEKGSGGLVKVQLISVANTEVGSVHYYVDDVELGVK